MANLLSLRFSALLLALGLGGCCANDVCESDDPLADAVKLRFSPNFTVSDLDTIIIQRYPKRFTATTRPENVILLRNSAQARDSILLNNNAPFARVGNTNLGAYRYVVQYLAHPNNSIRPVTTNVLVIDSIRVQGSYYNSSACCTNYRNTGKTAFIQGKTFDLTQLPSLEIPK
ncbi:hypothetical protein [Hymenobacter ruricola]|uniref:Lipoprotein n=1 Tax=Hymenobacter ruricola TaxID=2791023 RepID=A0ABS0I9K6_9BACT|nr:hypothetical protein [Hymenobacter ruricola]MBF9223620.1 hypothetical protein [Hymenobacter ruricola]